MNHDKLESKNIVEEMETSFLEYSMSVIVARALPDLRDGLKPVHRRILYSMYESGYTPDKQFRKSAKTVGEVMGNYHPHGDTAIYESMVRMAQPFSYRHMLVDGHGNFGSMDGDGAAAMRYTEARLSKISMELLRDINKDTVDFEPNFDGTSKEPIVLPSRFPNILVNGTMGIAVGMATNIPPHNLGEVIDGCVAYIDNNDITTLELMEHVKGPDFPTGAIILGNNGIKKAYETGKGTITLRGRAEIVEEHGKSKIIITELPYQVNKKVFQEKIGELVRDKIIDGIADLHEETNLENGIKIVVTLKKEANANVVLNNLYKHTQLQMNFGITMLMLDEGQPKTLGLKDIISKYINFQRGVIVRRTRFELDKAEKRAHILEGLKIALDNIDEVIKIIKESESDVTAKNTLKVKFNLDDVQAEAILEMRLRRLTGLERDKIENEIKQLLELIANLKDILAHDERVLAIIKEELLEIKNKYADERRTHIDMTAIEYIEDESLIPVEDIIITLTDNGYIKRMPVDTYKSQNRGGVGVKGMSTNEEDYVKYIISGNTHDYIMFFTNKGRVYRIKGYEIPSFSRQSKGLPVVNLLALDKDESISNILSVNKGEEYKYLLFVTKFGVVKRTSLDEFENIRNNGKLAITLKENDELISVRKTTGDNYILIGSNQGRMVRFNEKEVRIMGRSASGVRGINMPEDALCVGAEISNNTDEVLIVTEKGYGKRTNVDEFRETKRGSKGVKALNITEKNGTIVEFKTVNKDQDLMIITDSGIIIRVAIDQISLMGRATQGVKLINLKEEQKVSTITVVAKENKEDNITEDGSEEQTLNENSQPVENRDEDTE